MAILQTQTAIFNKAEAADTIPLCFKKVLIAVKWPTLAWASIGLIVRGRCEQFTDSLDIEQVCMTTNGSRLAVKAEQLKQNGLARLWRVCRQVSPASSSVSNILCSSSAPFRLNRLEASSIVTGTDARLRTLRRKRPAARLRPACYFAGRVRPGRCRYFQAGNFGPRSACRS